MVKAKFTRKQPMYHRLALAFCTLALASCSSPREPGMAEPRCRAAGAEAQLGQTISDYVAEDARAQAGAMRARVLRIGQPATTDVDPQRLNIEVDETGRIRRLRCG
jgi:hypothetical protein